MRSVHGAWAVLLHFAFACPCGAIDGKAFDESAAERSYLCGGLPPLWPRRTGQAPPSPAFAAFVYRPRPKR